jgi:hypothetical protein
VDVPNPSVAEPVVPSATNTLFMPPAKPDDTTRDTQQTPLTDATAATPVQTLRGCSADDANLFAHSILDAYAIPVPAFAVTGTERSNYKVGVGAIELEKCAKPSEMAHEIGHYVLDLANGFDWGRHQQAAAELFAGGGWIRGSETSPGVEYAAHCIGNQLWGYGAYTKCPNEQMMSNARTVIDTATNLSR